MADAHLGTATDAPASAVTEPAEIEGGKLARSEPDGNAPGRRTPGSTTDEQPTIEPDAPVTLSWAEQEVVDALKRLARAQSDVLDLEARAAKSAGPTFESADIERLEQLQGSLAHAHAKAVGRFGRGAARERLDELLLSERLVLERMGVASYSDYRAVIEAPSVERVDPQVLAFAQRELTSAKAAWLEVQALEIPPTESEPVEPVTPEIDLTDGRHAGDVA